MLLSLPPFLLPLFVFPQHFIWSTMGSAHDQAASTIIVSTRSTLSVAHAPGTLSEP